MYEEFEDTKEVIRIRKWKKNRKHNGQAKNSSMYKFYNVFNDLKKTITFQNDFFTFPPVNDPFTFIVIFKSKRFYSCPMHWG